MEKIISRRNILLLKDDIGKSKPCSFKLPPNGFAFGRAENKDYEGAGKLTSSWMTHQTS